MDIDPNDFRLESIPLVDSYTKLRISPYSEVELFLFLQLL